MQVANVPARIERSPSAAASERRSGAIPWIPPSNIARDPKLAKPQSAYDAITALRSLNSPAAIALANDS